MEGDAAFGNAGVVIAISIHALRVEGDRHLTSHCYLSLLISIHALRVEGDVCAVNEIRHLRISIHALRVEGD